jgi:hypothetical protein
MVIWEKFKIRREFSVDTFSLRTIWHLPLELKDLEDVC